MLEKINKLIYYHDNCIAEDWVYWLTREEHEEAGKLLGEVKKYIEEKERSG